MLQAVAMALNDFVNVSILSHANYIIHKCMADRWFVVCKPMLLGFVQLLGMSDRLLLLRE